MMMRVKGKMMRRSSNFNDALCRRSKLAVQPVLHIDIVDSAPSARYGVVGVLERIQRRAVRHSILSKARTSCRDALETD